MMGGDGEEGGYYVIDSYVTLGVRHSLEFVWCENLPFQFLKIC